MNRTIFLIIMSLIFLNSCFLKPFGSVPQGETAYCHGARLSDGSCKWDQATVTNIALSGDSLNFFSGGRINNWS